jgi:hypothetical protein
MRSSQAYGFWAASGLGDGHAFLAGLEYAIKQRYKVINLSLGTTKPQYFSPLHDLLDRAYQGWLHRCCGREQSSAT